MSYADDIIDGMCDSSGDYTYQYNCKSKYKHKETDAERKIRTVRKELAILIKKNKRNNIHQAVGKARQYINLKYGKGWRERGLMVNDEDQWKDLKEYSVEKDI